MRRVRAGGRVRKRTLGASGVGGGESHRGRSFQEERRGRGEEWKVLGSGSGAGV